MNEKQQLRKMFADISADFKVLGTQHSKKFLIALEMHIEDLDPTDKNKYLVNYFRACIKAHGNNLGCNQATKMLTQAYKKVFGMTV